jgi:23S rRNA (cytidine1920-2'-O)/16S rRNA (cytidine1409-2'-O)-methyltransferase
MKQRLDMELVARGLAPSRSRAGDAIARGRVRVAGARALKAGQTVSPDAVIEVDDEALDYVSRGALKLIVALDTFGFDPARQVCLDVGASTGGFSEVLLVRGAAKVYAVDAGHGQLHPRLAADPRLVNLENRNVRDLNATMVPQAVEALVCDVSFISLKLALPPALARCAAGAWAALLVKPQFELGPGAVGKGGIVRDPDRAEAAAEETAAWLAHQPGWRALGLIPSPMTGGDGNREFLLGAQKA